MRPLCPVLVGRGDLVALADRRLAAARTGTGHLLFLAGDVWPLVLRNGAILVAYAVLLLGVARATTRKTLD